MSRRIEARLERAAKPSQKSQTFLSSFLSQLLLPLSLLFAPACYHLKTLPRGPTHSRVSWSLRLLRICRIGKCKVMGAWGRGRGRKRASMRTSKGISSASSMQSSSQENENVVADKQQRGRGKPRGTSSRHFARGERGVSVTRVPLIR